MPNLYLVRLSQYLHTMNCFNWKNAGNPSSINLERFTSQDQVNQLVTMARAVMNKGGWSPAHAMIDKSQAEYNALKNGELLN